MAVNTKKVTGTRDLKFASLDEVLAAAEAIDPATATTLGNWSAAQIVEHVARFMTASREGFPPELKPPLLVRLPFMLVRGLVVNRKPPRGVKLPQQMVDAFIPPADFPWDKAIAHLRAEVSPALQLRLAKHPGRLMLLWPQTGEIEPVAAAPLDALPLAWSADHKRLLFASARRGGEEQLYEYHMERRDLSPITIGPAEHPRGAYMGGGRLVVHRSEQRSRYAVPHQSLVQTGLAGRIERVIAEDLLPGSLHFLPGQDRIVYEKVDVRPRSAGPNFYQSMVATRGLEPGATEQVLARGREPTPTPDGQWIVFASESSAGYRLRRMRVDGTSRVPIHPGDTEERMPSVSPDGEFVAFVQVVNGRRRLVVRRFDGTQERMLLREGWSEFPVW